MAPPDGRWNDQAVDGLAGRVTTIEDQQQALVQLPERVANLKEQVERQRLEAQEADRREERRIVALREDLATGLAQLHERFDQVDLDHTEAADRAQAIAKRTAGVDWPTVIAVVTGVAVPLATALIATQ